MVRFSFKKIQDHPFNLSTIQAQNFMINIRKSVSAMMGHVATVITWMYIQGRYIEKVNLVCKSTEKVDKHTSNATKKLPEKSMIKKINS